jgi:hypothetical protein
MKQILAIALFLALFTAHGWSQDSSQPSSESAWHPTVNGELGSLAFLPEAERVNLLSGGLNLASTYDDNAFSSSTNHVGSVGYMIAPSLSIVEARSQTLWNLNYNPGFLWNQRSSSSYQGNQNIDSNLQYRITEHLSARIHDRFIDESTSFNQLNQNPLLPGGNVLSQSNQSTTTPLSTQKTNVTDIDLVDQIGEGTNVGISGNLNKLNFRDESTSPVELFNNESWSGQVFYSHHLSGLHTIGVTYTFQKIATFGSIREHAQSQSTLLFYTLNFKPSVVLSVFAGPDRSTTNSQFQYSLGPLSVPVDNTESRWLVDEGITFTWQGQATSARINLIHHITDGGGLTGAVQLYSASLGLRRQISREWTADFNLNYGNNDPLSHVYGNAFSGYGGTVGLDRTLGEHFSVGARYGRDFQRYEDFGITNSTGSSANHNRGWITVSYHFSRALGA